MSSSARTEAVTILLRGAADRILDEAERSMQDALHVIRDLYREPKIVPGGGAFEMEIARRLREWGVGSYLARSS